MDQETPRHEKIKFRRDEIIDLGALPSACTEPPLGQAAIGRGFRILFRLASTLGVLVLVLAGAVYAIGATGFGTERLRSEAEKAIEKMAGVDVAVALGPARLTLDGSSFLALRVDDVTLKTADGAPMAEAGSMRFGVRLIPLLSGQVRLTSARISDARIMAAAMPARNGDWTTVLRNQEGLIDPEKLSDAVFTAVHGALDAVGVDTVRQIDLQNVEFVLPEAGRVRLIKVTDATARQTGPGKLELSAETDIDGRAVNLAASAARDVANGRVTELQATVEMPAPDSEAADEANPEQGSTVAAGGNTTAPPGNRARLGSLVLRVAGSEQNGESPSRLSAGLTFAGSVLDFGTRGLLPADGDLNAVLVAGSNKVSISRLTLKSGRSTFNFEGSIGPKPPEGQTQEEPSYRYDLVSDGSTVSPDNSPEPALNFIARIAGVYRTESRKLVAETIAVKSGMQGELLGTASLQFADGKVPGLSVALNVHDMAVSHVKQLWPWFTAGGARLWVLKNLFGGRVTDASLQYQVVPGRIGNGVPLSASEVFGRFSVEGSRFDTAGRIPPIRDAVGVIAFQGTDVDISLSSGTVYMPSGRVVAASNGTLKIRNAIHPPVIGALDIDVAGEAPAIAELASYEPINAMRHVGILPEELTGTVTGNVKADIPLQKGVDTSQLGWLVSLSYENLAVAKPLDGQMVTAADGTIVVDPLKAVIVAKGALNGLPASLNIIEPLKPDGPPRSRKVTLILDDKTRQTFMPGLSALLGGTLNVDVDRLDDGSRKVSADLTDVKLNIPWAGWSKGAGVPADMSFTMKQANGTTSISDFDLGGKSFAIGGSMVLNGGSLSSARFDRVQLNRDDSVAVSVKRSGKDYSVAITGDSLDARPLIKQFTADSQTATKSTGSSSVSVSAEVKSLVGFHEEALGNFKLDYTGSGSTLIGLNVSAVTGSGGAVTINNSNGGGQRKLAVRSSDAGAILRFLNVYEHMQGGGIALSLTGQGDGPMRGQVDVRDFTVTNEPKLASIVSTPPAGDSRSLNQAVKADIDTSRVKFERGYAEIEKGGGYLKVGNGVLRGPVIGTTFQGTLYDQNSNMDMTGTFMPAYGVNRIFGDLPIIGVLLGNGRDGGLIGVTYRLKGKTSSPRLDINPLSVIAPGIFRSIFEFR